MDAANTECKNDKAGNREIRNKKCKNFLNNWSLDHKTEGNTKIIT